MLTTRQQHCLEGIGIQVWTKRKAASDNRPDPGPVVEYSPALPSENPAPIKVSPNDIDESPRASNKVSADLPMTDVPTENLKPAVDTPVTEIQYPPVLDSWETIIATINDCHACELAQNCTQKVPGVGNRRANLLIVGEGPGHDEDIRGEPFVGRSGKLLDRMLAAIGINREQIYITNIVKCRPPNNRDPKQAEALQCRAYLEAQIAQIAPRVILSVGRVSAHNLLGSNQPVGKLIQQMHCLPGTEIPLKVTYHPAYLLRNPSAKAIVWQDLKMLQQMLQ